MFALRGLKFIALAACASSARSAFCSCFSPAERPRCRRRAAAHPQAGRYASPLIVAAVAALKVRSYLIDGEAVAYDDNGRENWTKAKAGG